MAALAPFLLLAICSAQAVEHDDVLVAKHREVLSKYAQVLMTEYNGGDVDMALVEDVLASWAPVMTKCEIAVAREPLFLTDVSPMDCLGAQAQTFGFTNGVAPSGEPGTWAIIKNARLANTAVSRTSGYHHWLFDVCKCVPSTCLGADAKCIPGTHFFDIEDIIYYTFDDQGRIVSNQDWWDAMQFETFRGLSGESGVPAESSAMLNSHATTLLAEAAKEVDDMATAKNTATMNEYAEDRLAIYNGHVSERSEITMKTLKNVAAGWAPKLTKCEKPVGKFPFVLTDTTPEECGERMVKASDLRSGGSKPSPLGTWALVTNARITDSAVNGSSGFQHWFFDVCRCVPSTCLDADAKCIPGTEYKDMDDIMLYTFDDQYRVLSFQDWWDNRQFVQFAGSTTAETDAMFNSHLTALPSSLLMTSVIVAFSLSAGVFAFRMRKRWNMIKDTEAREPLLQA